MIDDQMIHDISKDIMSNIVITSQNEARYTGYKAAEKTVEGECANETTIYELDDTRQKHIQ